MDGFYICEASSIDQCFFLSESLLFILVLVFVIGALVVWAFKKFLLVLVLAFLGYVAIWRPIQAARRRD